MMSLVTKMKYLDASENSRHFLTFVFCDMSVMYGMQAALVLTYVQVSDEIS